MALKITPIESLPKGTIKREQMRAEIERAKADPAAKPTFFQCRCCGHNTPLTEVGRRRANGSLDCKACCEKATAIKNGTYRDRGATIESRQRSRNNAAKKSYANGKLPKWMFS